MITDNEIKFLQFVNNSSNAYVRKFNLIVKQKVLTQLSRSMLTELFVNYRDNIDNKFNVNAVCMQCANSLFNIVLNISKKYFELQAKWEIQLQEELQTIYAQEDAEEEQRLSNLLNNDEHKIALYKSRNIFNKEYVENTNEMDTEKFIEIFDEINEKDLELSIQNINDFYTTSKLKNKEILLENNIVTPSVIETPEVVTEEKIDEFIKPKVHKKTDNTTPLLNKNKKKTNKR